jgi:hypothetical protein
MFGDFYVHSLIVVIVSYRGIRSLHIGPLPKTRLQMP